MLAKWDEMALVGRVARAHGIRGQVIVNPDTDFPEQRFQPGAELFVNRAGVVEPVLVTTVRFHRERPVIGLRGIDDMNAANGLAGSELRVPVERLASLPPGSLLQARSGRVPCGDARGRAGRCRHRRRGHDGRKPARRRGARGEVLVPFVAAICTTIDPAGKRIVIEPPAGLLEVNAARRPG
jgi:16S rRNA processing protein RimM